MKVQSGYFIKATVGSGDLTPGKKIAQMPEN